MKIIALGELAAYGVGEYQQEGEEIYVPPIKFEWRGKKMIEHRLKLKQKDKNSDDSDDDSNESEDELKKAKTVASPLKDQNKFNFQKGSAGQNRQAGTASPGGNPSAQLLEQTAGIMTTEELEGTSPGLNLGLSLQKAKKQKKKKNLSPEEEDQLVMQEVAEATGIQMTFDDFDRDDPENPFPGSVFDEEDSLNDSGLDHSMLEDYFFHEVYCWNDVPTTEEPTANDNFKSVYRPTTMQTQVPFEVLFAAKQARRIKFTRQYQVASTADLNFQSVRARPISPILAPKQKSATPPRSPPPEKSKPKALPPNKARPPTWMSVLFSDLAVYMRRLWHTKIPKHYLVRMANQLSVDDRTADFIAGKERSVDTGEGTVSFMPRDKQYNQSTDWQSQDVYSTSPLVKNIPGGTLALRPLPKKVPDERKMSVQPFDTQLDANFEKQAEKAGDNVQVVLTFTSFATVGNESQRVTRKIAPINPVPAVSQQYQQATAVIKAEVYVKQDFEDKEDGLMPPRAFPRFAEIDIPMRELEDPMDRFRRAVNARARQEEMLPKAKDDPWKELSLLQRYRSKNPVFERALREYYAREDKAEPGSTLREEHELEHRIKQLQGEVQAAQQRRREETDIKKFLMKEYEEGDLDTRNKEGRKQYWEDISKHLENPEMLDLDPPNEEPELIRKLPASTAIRIYQKQELDKLQGKRPIKKEVLDLDDESPQQQSLLAIIVDKNTQKDTGVEKPKEKKALRGLARKMNKQMLQAQVEIDISKANPIQLVTPVVQPPDDSPKRGASIKKKNSDQKDQSSSSAQIPQPNGVTRAETTVNNPLGLPSLNKPSLDKYSALRSRSADWEVQNEMRGLPAEYQYRRNIHVRGQQDANVSDYEAEFDEEGHRIDPKYVYTRPNLLHMFHEPTVDVLKKKHAEAPFLEGVTPRAVDFYAIYGGQPESKEERKQRNNPAVKKQKALQAMRDLLGPNGKSSGNDQLAELLLRKKGNLVKFSEPNKNSAGALPELNKNLPVSFSLDAGQKSSTSNNQKSNSQAPPRTILRNKGQT